MKEKRNSCKSMIVRFHSLIKVLPINSATCICEENHLETVHVTKECLKHLMKSSEHPGLCLKYLKNISKFLEIIG